MQRWRSSAERLAALAGGRGDNVSILVPACAKVNLALEVGPRRPDGFHEVRTVLQAVNLRDLLSLVASGDAELEVSCGWPGVPEGEGNLAYRAVELMREACRCPDRGVRVQLFKAIPPAAGLGGGSSDAAATLRGLAWLWQVRLPAGEMTRLAAELGSDVPFFLTGGTALGEGRGERLRPLPALPDCLLVVVCPPDAVSTAEVYRLLDESPRAPMPPGRGVGAVSEALGRGDLAGVAAALWNDLRPVTERLVPGVRQARETLLECGALGAEMSGSGPAVFGMFSSLSGAQLAFGRARARGFRAYLCRPVGNWPLYPGATDFD